MALKAFYYIFRRSGNCWNSFMAQCFVPQNTCWPTAYSSNTLFVSRTIAYTIQGYKQLLQEVTLLNKTCKYRPMCPFFCTRTIFRISAKANCSFLSAYNNMTLTETNFTPQHSVMAWNPSDRKHYKSAIHIPEVLRTNLGMDTNRHRIFVVLHSANNRKPSVCL